MNEEQTWTQPLGVATDIGFIGPAWPIYERYTLEEGPELQPVIRRHGRRRGFWVPGFGRLADELGDLSHATDDAIHQWVSEHGFIGVAGDPATVSEDLLGGEFSIRPTLERLSQIRALIERIQHPSVGDVEEMLRIAEMGAGHLVDVDHLSATTGFKKGVVKSEWASDRAGADLQALHAVNSMLQQPLQRLVHVTTWTTQAEGFLRLQPSLWGHGPLATAYIETLSEVSRMTVSWETGELRIDWRAPRHCHRCRKLFKPRKVDSRWCSDKCRWAASKAARRMTKRSFDEEADA